MGPRSLTWPPLRVVDRDRAVCDVQALQLQQLFDALAAGQQVEAYCGGAASDPVRWLLRRQQIQRRIYKLTAASLAEMPSAVTHPEPRSLAAWARGLLREHFRWIHLAAAARRLQSSSNVRFGKHSISSCV